MVAGMPGTGIGGIFYFLLVAMMPLKEILQLIKGKSSIRRWLTISLQVSFVATILIAMWGQVWLLKCLLMHLPRGMQARLFLNGSGIGHVGILAASSAFAGFISLAFVAFLVHSLRLILRLASLLGMSAKPA